MSDQLPKGRRLAFDYGDVRTGVAVSDFHGIIASPLATLRTQEADFVDQLRSIIVENEPIYIVIGEPKHLSGADSQKMQSVAQFAALLEGLTQVPIHRIDERMTTVTAASQMRASGKSAKDSKGSIDAAAATLILEAAMSAEKLGTLS